MAELNEKAKKVFALKYSTKKTRPWKETCRNIADFMAEANRKYGASDEKIREISDEYFEMLYNLNTLAGGRIIANAGTGIKNLANCFVLGIDDSRQSIYGTLMNAAEVFAMGGGVGYDFSKIRERGHDIKTTGGKACLTGDTVVYKDRPKNSVAENSVTIKKLFDLQERRQDLIPLISLRCLDENTHALIKNKLLKIVCNDIQDVYTIKTTNGYEIRATSNHRFMTENFEYQELCYFNVGDKIAVNGIRFCESCGKIISGQHLCITCHNKQQAKDDARDTTARQRKMCRDAAKDYCEMCNTTDKRFEIHHIDENPHNNLSENLINLCPKCHQGLHAAKRSFGNPYRQKYITLDSIISIEYSGKEVVYDLQMSSPNHNFIANGFVSHNSGPLSFMTLFDQTGEVIQQASRRGAQIGLMNVSHPDIERFIDFKSTLDERNGRIVEEYHRNLKAVNGTLKETKYEKILKKTLMDDQLTHFNISVLLTDDFMQAVEDNKDWDLISPADGSVVKTVKAKDILMKMATRAWESGDPGQLFYDRINEDNLVPYIGAISATNPCGEVPLLPYESCILASINLHEMYDKKTDKVDYDKLKKYVKLGTRFLEDVTEITEAPVEVINETTKNLRRLGLGVLGFADLLVEMGIPYDSQSAVVLSEYLSWFISFHAWETSFELAVERGSFGYLDTSRANWNVVDKVLYDSPYGVSSIPREFLHAVGVRNNCNTSIAPTGSIALIAGTNSAIEPFFALAYTRNITEGVGNVATDQIFEVNPALERKLTEEGYDKEARTVILKYAAQEGTLTGCTQVSEKMQTLFKTANEIPWKRHVDIQAAWQKYMSNAISKTTNLAEEASVQDIYDTYFYMWKQGVKGGTVYRNNSKLFQILEKPKGEDK